MLENDPRYARNDFTVASQCRGGTAPARHDLALADHLARRRALRAAPSGGRGR